MRKSKTIKYYLYNKVIDVCIGTRKELVSHIKRYYKNKVTSETLDGLIKLVDRENPYGTGIGVPEKINGYNYNIIYINIENYPIYRKSIYSCIRPRVLSYRGKNRKSNRPFKKRRLCLSSGRHNGTMSSTDKRC